MTIFVQLHQQRQQLFHQVYLFFFEKNRFNRNFQGPAPVALCATAFFNQTFSTLVGSMGSAGSTATLLSSPFDVDFDGYRNLYVVDRNNHRIQRFSPG